MAIKSTNGGNVSTELKTGLMIYLDQETGKLFVKDNEGNQELLSNYIDAGSEKGYKEYVAFITQGEGNPIVDVMVDEVSTTEAGISWVRTEAGIVVAEEIGADPFPLLSTTIIIGQLSDQVSDPEARYSISVGGEITITATDGGSGSDAVLDRTPVLIRVYPS